MRAWAADQVFRGEAIALYQAWGDDDGASPAAPSRGDRPGIGWEVDALVTWVALNAFKEFRDAHGGFAGGSFVHDVGSMRGLALLATAASMLALAKADGRVGP